MTMKTKLFAALAVAAAATATASHAADVKSISRIAFGPGDTLFVADWKAARVLAFTLPAAAQRKAGETFNIGELDALLASALGASKVTVEDMAVRPGTSEVYLALGVGPERAPAVVAVTPDRKVRRVDLGSTRSTSVALAAPDTSDFAFWHEAPERSYTVTDMKWHDGELFVAGLSNQDFASTLRRIRYPFDDKQSMSSIEIYHTTHNQVETRAPIRAMAFARLGGKPYLVAAYTCTPLVTIPLDALKDGAHVHGKIIAELGYGNTPAGMIGYSRGEQGKSQDMLLLLNYERVADLIPVADIEAANGRPELDKPVPFGQIVGLDPVQAPLVGVTRADNLDDRFMVAVRWQLEKGDHQLVTFDKGMNLRLSDYLSEYNFQQYSYKDKEFQLKYLKPAQDMLMTQEGHADFIKPSN